MQAKYTRLFTNDQGASRFEDAAVELLPGFTVAGGVPLHTAPFHRGNGTFWVGAPPGWKRDANPGPQRMIWITVQGSYQVTTSDNVTRSFPVGSVLLGEDVSGLGHSGGVVSAEDLIVFVVSLPDDEQC